MDYIKLKNEYKDLFEHLSNYVLIKDSGRDWFTIFDVSRQGYLHVEEGHRDLVHLLLEANIKVVNDVKEVIDPSFIHYGLVWDEEQNKMIKFSQKEAGDYFKKKKEERKKKGK